MRVDLRLALPAAIAWAMLAIALAWPSGLGGLAIAGWSATCLLIVAASLGRRHPVLIVVALASCAASILLTSAAAGAPHRQPAALLEAANAGRFVTATAETTQTVFKGTGSFTVTLTSVSIGEELSRVSIPARVFGEPAGRDLGIGAAIAVAGTLSPTAPEDELAFLLFSVGPPELVKDPPRFLGWANDMRSNFRSAAEDLPGNGGALLPGLAIGDTSAVGVALDDAMKTSSLSHLTAVSGANCAIVIGLIMLAGGMLGISRGWRIASSVAVLIGFVVLVTPEPSVLRAAVMALLVLVSLGSGRPSRGVPVLALAVIGLLVADPWLARSYGFVLSVLATAGLLLLAGPLTRALGRWLPLPVAAVIAVPLAAQLACQPVLILLTASIPTYGVVANMLAGPAAPAATVLGLLACLALPVAPGLGSLLAQLAWIPSAWIAAVATFFAGLPGNRMPWLAGPLGVALLVVVTVLALVIVLRGPREVRRRDRVAAAVLVLILTVHVGVTAGNGLRTALTRPGNWQYAVCDVGQGDAVLVRSAGAVALIDTGRDPEPLTACLDELGISRIDVLVLTHFDVDHVGGAPAVVGRVDRALVGPSDGPEAERVLEQLRHGGARVEQVSRGHAGVLGGLGWAVLWPPARPSGIEAGNDASVVLAIDGADSCADGCLDSVFLGDLGERAQALLLATNRLDPVHVVKVSHHGSADQSARLYERLDAAVGLIGVGVDNGYGHPAPRLLDILAAHGTTVARTDLMGMLLVASGPEGEIELWSERSGEAGDVATAD